MTWEMAVHYDEITGNIVEDDVGQASAPYRPVSSPPAHVSSGEGGAGWWHDFSRLALGGVLGFVLMQCGLFDKSGNQTQSPPCDPPAAVEMELPDNRGNSRQFPESFNEIPEISKLLADIEELQPNRFHSKRPWEKEEKNEWGGGGASQLIVVCCECGTRLDVSAFMRWASFDCVCPACNAHLHVEQ